MDQDLNQRKMTRKQIEELVWEVVTEKVRPDVLE